MRRAPRSPFLRRGVAIPGAIDAFLNGLNTIGTAESGDERSTSSPTSFFFPFSDASRQGVNLPRPGLRDHSQRTLADADVADAANQGFVRNAPRRGFSSIASGAPRYPAIDSLEPGPADSRERAEPGGRRRTLRDGRAGAAGECRCCSPRTRARRRARPLGGQARIDVAVVDLDGNVLGFARSQDALDRRRGRHDRQDASGGILVEGERALRSSLSGRSIRSARNNNLLNVTAVHRLC